MMTAKIKTFVFLALAFVVLLTTGFAFSGQAFSPSSAKKGGHAANDVSGYTVSINFKLNQKNPDRIAAAQLVVTASTGDNTANTVHVSLDDGTTWTFCRLQSGNSWYCEFSPDTQPYVGDAENLLVSAQGEKMTSMNIEGSNG